MWPSNAHTSVELR